MKQAPELAKVPSKFLECRSFRHSYRHVSDQVTRRRKRVIEFTRVQQCRRCKAEVHTTYTAATGWAATKRRYHYPDLYQVKSGASVYDSREAYVHNILND